MEVRVTKLFPLLLEYNYKGVEKSTVIYFDIKNNYIKGSDLELEEELQLKEALSEYFINQNTFIMPAIPEEVLKNLKIKMTQPAAPIFHESAE